VSAPHPHRIFWDTQYRESFAPRELHRRCWALDRAATDRSGLDVACSATRISARLACGVDISPVGLQIAQREADAVACIPAGAADLHALALPLATFDLVCVFRFLDRALYPRQRHSFGPGGTSSNVHGEQRVQYKGLGRAPDAIFNQPNRHGLFPQFGNAGTYRRCE